MGHHTPLLCLIFAILILCIWTGSATGAKCGKKWNKSTKTNEILRCVAYKWDGKLRSNDECTAGWKDNKSGVPYPYMRWCAFQVDSNKNPVKWMYDCGKVSCPKLTGIPECPSMAPGDLKGRWEVNKGSKTLGQCRNLCMNDPTAIGMTTKAGATETRADTCYCEHGVHGVETYADRNKYKTCVFKGKY